MNKVKVTLVRSINGCTKTQLLCARSLGLRRINAFKIFTAHPSIMGNVRKIGHLLKVEEYKGDV
ncbi:MAG: 50S ribosomal protein L30 [Alphaproteobacteria bacterium]|nr:50S ribosomal protein L30 [Alphaproteobacteria bacterium]